MKARQKRLVFVGLAVVGVGAAATLALSALQSNIAYFFSPTQVLANEHPGDAVFRVGGLVVDDTLKRQQDGLTVRFDVTDNAATVPVSYTGILPDLFGEGQGVVAKGRIGNDGVFYAEEVLAKHDESYMPPEVADTLQTAHVDGVIDATTRSLSQTEGAGR
ncbi:cytochrome c maturation protein CcmE [Thiohalocapsa marina]|uniref:Cytochrome c-type biogenesis protein CcmE n=1 Tax=Thiohalocapsa marina TaxID=424902 RepID=A0A5M8FKD5_9GAMM|nr:cytochrome c maturation protein CcmE [Thiohalocapsa marina]KAA6182905.1 cytochrome c maturation protein CcmE [Thiohalocapsa marina]